MRGFVITIISLSLLSLVLAFANSLHNSHLEMERLLKEPLPLTYAAFTCDSIALDVNNIAGPVMSIQQRNDSTGILISDRLPGENFSGLLSSYENFLEGEFAAQTHAMIDVNFSNLSDGTVVFINEGYIYINNQSSNETIFTSEGGTGALAYDINITVSGLRANLTGFDFNESGDLNVTLAYTDRNGTETEGGRVFSDSTNTFEVTYIDGGKITISIGLKNGKSGSLWMEAQAAEADASWFVLLPKMNETKKLGYSYDATVAYGQGSATKTGMIGR